MKKAIKVMLVPNNKQRTKMFAYADVARFAYNWAIAREKEQFAKDGKFLSDGDLRKEFTILKHIDEYVWLNSVSNNVTKQAIKDAVDAYKKFFKSLAKAPRFKSKKKSQPAFYQDTDKIKFTETHVKFEGFSESKKTNKQKLNWVRLAEHGRIPTGCKYMNPRITFDGLNWWISVVVEMDYCKTINSNDGIGIDLGLKNLAICSDTKTYKNINKTHTVKKLEKKKARLQRSISRKYLVNNKNTVDRNNKVNIENHFKKLNNKNKKKGKYCKTCNIVKQEKLLLKVTKRLTNIRDNYLSQTTTEIVNRKPRFIAIEDLNVRGMMKNKHLARAVQQQNFYKFHTQIQYKCEERGIQLIVADRFYPSSKLCSCCGNIKKDLKLSDRIYRCECGNVIDRDYQASLNLKAYGEKFAS